MARRAILVLLATTLAGLASAPAAAAVPSSVRIQGATHEVLPRTPVNERSSGGMLTDSDGTSFTTEYATALGATAAALRRGGLPWDMSVSSFGPFINSLAGLAPEPSDYSNWWSLVVNGYAAPVGAGSLQTIRGDRYLWFQNPDATFARDAVLLETRISGGTAKHGFTPDQTVSVTTLANDLAKVDNAAEARRFSTSEVQTPAQFPPLAGTTLHVGSRVYAAAGPTTSIADLAPGTYAVWAEKAMDATTVYAPSERTLINVGVRPSLGEPAAWRRGRRTVAVRLDLNKAAALEVAVMAGARQLAGYRATRPAGDQTLSVRLSSAAPPATPLTVRVRATDAWGRSVTKNLAAAQGH